MLNGEHTVVQNLDIFEKVGRGAAHDEIVPFTVKGGKLKYNGEVTNVKGNKVAIQFVKVSKLVIALIMGVPCFEEKYETCIPKSGKPNLKPLISFLPSTIFISQVHRNIFTDHIYDKFSSFIFLI